MHLSLEELLEARERGVALDPGEHAASCPECAAEIARLRALKASLAALSSVPPPRDLWPEILERATVERTHRRLARAGWVAACLAAAVSLVVGVRGTIESLHEVRLAREVKALIAQSQQLEGTLRSWQGGSRALSGRAVGTIVALEDRIAFVDARLAPARDGKETSEETLALWRERVRLLDALVNVHTTREAYVGL